MSVTSKPGIETTIRILLIVIILFNALSPTIGVAKSLTAQNTPIDALGRESQGPESEIPLSSSNFSRPIPRIGERPNNTASTGSSQSTPSQSAVEALPITFIENVG